MLLKLANTMHNLNLFFHLLNKIKIKILIKNKEYFKGFCFIWLIAWLYQYFEMTTSYRYRI